MLAWRALSTGVTCVTGDVAKDFPDTGPKPYASIMAIPIHGAGRVLGVVSIDSSRRHHFDLEWSELERYLLPYVCLLGWTLTKSTLKLSAPAGDGP
jgi:signal transduction protein with GAF and PtsI domain